MTVNFTMIFVTVFFTSFKKSIILVEFHHGICNCIFHQLGKSNQCGMAVNFIMLYVTVNFTS